MALKTICLIVMFAVLLSGRNINGYQLPTSGIRSSKNLKSFLVFHPDITETELSPSDDPESDYPLEYPGSLYTIVIIIAAVTIGITAIVIFLMKFRKMRNRYINWLAEYLYDVQLLYSRFDQSRKMVDMLFDNSKNAKILVKIHSDDLTTRIVCSRINRAFAEAFSIPVNQASGKELISLLPCIDYSMIHSAIENSSLNSTPDFKYCYKTIRFFAVSVSTTEKTSVCLCFTDITKEKQLIGLLTENLRNTNSAAAAGNLGIWFWNIHEDRLHLSANYKKMLGYEEYELSSRVESIQRLLHPEDRGHIIDHFYRCTNGSMSIYSIDFRMKKKNGTWCWIRSHTRSICDSKGLPAQLVGIHMDVTEEKRLKNKFDIICDSSPIPLIILDKFQRIKQINNKAQEFRNNQSEAIGLRIGEWLRCNNCRSGCGDSPACPECLLAKILASSVTSPETIGPVELPMDLWLPNAKRHHIPLYLSVCVKNFSHDTESYTAVWLEDISPQKQAESNYSKILDSMRQQNRKLNALQLHAQKLLKRAKKAETAHEEFLNGISHEINIPLSGIISMTSLLAETRLSGIQQHYVQVLKSSGEVMTDSLKNILYLPELKSNEIKINKHKFNFVYSIEKVIDVWYYRAREKQLELYCIISPDIPEFLIGDSSRVEQIVNNLLSNTICFCSDEAVSLEISQENHSHNIVNLSFKVQNSGTGISSENIDTNNYPAGKLSLEICYHLIKLLGGKIILDQHNAQKLEIVFSIPFEVAEDQSASQLDNLDDITDQTVLIASEYKFEIKTLATYLEGFGCSVIKAGSTSAFNHIIENAQNPVDIIVFNPEMKNFDFNKLLQHCGNNYPLLAVIADNNTDIDKLTDINGCFLKPLKRSAIPKQLRAITTQAPINKILPAKNFSFVSSDPTYDNIMVLLVYNDPKRQHIAETMLEKLGCYVRNANNVDTAISMTSSIEFDLVIVEYGTSSFDYQKMITRIREVQAPEKAFRLTIVAVVVETAGIDQKTWKNYGFDDFITIPVNMPRLRTKLSIWLPCDRQSIPYTENDHNDDVIFSKEKLVRKTRKNQYQLHNIINGFIREIPIIIASIEEYITTEDMESAKLKARIIKGSAHGIGAVKLKKAAERLEFMTGKGDFSESINTMLCLEAEFEKVKSSLRNFLMECS